MATTKVTTGGITDATITTADIANGAVTSAQIASGTITNANLDSSAGIVGSKLADSSVSSAKIADQAVTLDKLPHGTSSNNGKFLRANNGADPTFEDVPAGGISDVVADTTPQLGGNLDTNSFEISFDDNHSAIFGDGSDLKVLHTGSESRIDFSNTSHNLILMGAGGSQYIDLQPRNGHSSVKAIANGSAELYYDNSKKFNTSNEGCVVTGGGLAVARGGSQYSGAIYFAGQGDTNHMLWQDYFDNPNGSRNSATGWDGIKWNCYNGLRLYRGDEAENIAAFYGNGACELYYDNSKKFETTDYGINIIDTASPQTGASSAGRNLVISGGGAMGMTLHTASSSSNCSIYFSDPGGNAMGAVQYLHNNDQIRLYLNNNYSTPVMQFNSNLTIFFNGNMYSNGNSYSTGSDLRLKSNLVPFTNTLDKLKQIVGYQFDIKCGSDRSQTRKSAGVIAQDVEKVYPELVEEGPGGYKHLEYSAFTGILVEAVKQLTTKVETLETKVAALEAA